jgi:uncharacterized protein (DUF427 family)
MTLTRIDPTARRIRARLGTRTVVDSTKAKLVYVEGRHPEYFVPVDNVDWKSLETRVAEETISELGTRQAVTDSDDAVIGQRYIAGLADGLVHFDFDAMDAWFEEDEQIWVHPRDPYRRVDVLESSRHIVIEVNGVIVASTDRPRLITETGLPARWYIPRADVNWSVLEASETQSYCQYKGTADWWHVSLDDGEKLVDVVWGYERPVPDASKLAGLVSFYAEHDAVETTVDGQEQIVARFDRSMFSPSLHVVNDAAA